MKQYQALVYPFSKSILAFFQPWTKNILSNIEITSLVTSNKAHDSLDIALYDKRPETGYSLQINLESSLSQADTLLIPEGKYVKYVHDQLIKLMIEQARAQKHILCCMELNQDESLQLYILCKENMVDFVYTYDLALETYHKYERIGLQRRTRNRLEQINTPIVFVSELIEGTQGKDITSGITATLKNKGYKISTVMEPGISQLIGLHGWNELILPHNKVTSIEDYVHGINRFIIALDYIEKPDLIVVQIPGGLMAYNDVITNSFGIYAYLFGQAINPDYCICCLNYENYNTEYAEKLIEFMYKKHGFEIDCFHFSNAAIDTNSSRAVESNKFIYLTQEDQNNLIINNFDSSNKIPVFNGLNKEGIESICAYLERKLGSYSSHSSII